MASLALRRKRSIDRLLNVHPLVGVKGSELIAKGQAFLERYCPGEYQIECTEGTRTPERQQHLKDTDKSQVGPWGSFHQYGLAIDLAIYCVKTKRYIWGDIKSTKFSVSLDIWKDLGHFGKGMGFEWGGDWQRFKDSPHFQFTFGKTTTQLKATIEHLSITDLWVHLTESHMAASWG